MIGAVILAGGKSSRMGTNKALLRLHPDEPPLVELIVNIVRKATSDIILVANNPAIYAWLQLPIVSDNYKESGPLGGIEAGLTASTHNHNLVVACDMPFLQPALLNFLAQQAENQPQKEAIVPLNFKGEPEPLCAIYSRATLTNIRQQLQSHKYKILELLNKLDVSYLTSKELERFDSELNSFVNLNRPTDLPPELLA